MEGGGVCRTLSRVLVRAHGDHSYLITLLICALRSRPPAVGMFYNASSIKVGTGRNDGAIPDLKGKRRAVLL
jgi:hypothetical protein